ncbi:MAG: DUF1003 domain-containing protein [Bacilli bacterium]|nr:DUF1003 domain-containing protein [Bacilli bacterium]
MEKREIVKALVNQKLEDKDREELIEMVINNPISVDVDKQQEENTTFGEKMADKISAIAGSWFFIMLFVLFLVLWIILNAFVLTEKIDPYPFILLNLVLSCISAIQAPIIMMSQNREAKKDSMRNQNDYIVDLKSELILEDLHRKLELILEHQDKLLDIYKKQLEKEE